MKVVFTPSARDQFLKALAYIRRDNPSAALSFRRKAEQSLSRLRNYPDSGCQLLEFPESHYRELIVPPYRFFYRVEDQVVWVVAVWHSAQLPDPPEE